MPLPNEYSCRIRDPSTMQKGSFRRIKEGRLSIIIGKLKGKTTTTTQAYRYPKKLWSKEEARNHCKKHKGSFTAEKINPFFQDKDSKKFDDKPVQNHMSKSFLIRKKVGKK